MLHSFRFQTCAMTGRTERKAEDFINAGFSGCLLKPFSYAELTQAIVNSIREYSQSDDDLFKAPKADFTTLLQGEEDVNGMLTLSQPSLAPFFIET